MLKVLLKDAERPDVHGRMHIYSSVFLPIITKSLRVCDPLFLVPLHMMRKRQINCQPFPTIRDHIGQGL